MALPFNVESWIWYGIVMWLAISRFVSRRLVLGTFKAFQLDDYIMLLALCFYTTLVVTINIVAVTNSNLLPPGYDVADITQDDFDERTYGSKLVLVVEECQCTVIWAAKACLLVMYLRFTVLAKENLAIRILAGYVAGSFVLMEILYLGVWCRPFSEYWAVPTDNVQCDAATNHLITNAVFNLTSDIAMLIIGLPIFIRVQIPLRQKIPLLLLFSLGIFVIISAILNKIYSFANPFGTEWVYWYLRESSTAVIVANMPYVWALYRRIPGLRPRTRVFVTDETCYAPGSVMSKRKKLGTSHSIGMDTVTGSRRSSLGGGSDEAVSGRPGVSAEEWLRDDYLAMARRNIAQDDVNPYTHPALFFTMAKQQNARKSGVQEFGQALFVQPVGRPGILPDPDVSPGASFSNQSAKSSSRRRSFGSVV